MVRGKEQDGRVYFSYSKCDGMSQHQLSVDKTWFDEHNTEGMTAEELDSLAYADRDNSKVEGKISWWGLG